MSVKRMVSEGLKKLVAGRQNFRCANKPLSNVVKNYKCPLWENDSRQGSFGEEGYQIDHIVEHSISKNDDESNLQALCLSCHSVKTRRFMIKKIEPEIKKEKQNNNNVYEVDEILDKRRKEKGWEYLIKWKDYNFSECTWEPKENIFNDKAIKKFEKEYKKLNKVRF